MKTETIIRAWKEPAFRASLTSEQLAALPESPSGKPMTELVEGDLSDVMGGLTIIRGGTNVVSCFYMCSGLSIASAVMGLCPSVFNAC